MVSFANVGNYTKECYEPTGGDSCWPDSWSIHMHKRSKIATVVSSLVPSLQEEGIIATFSPITWLLSIEGHLLAFNSFKEKHNSVS